MNEKHPHPPPGGLSLGDIYYVIFRHKWKILAISCVGLAVAIALPFIMPAAYESEAKLFIRYVMESKAPAQVSDPEARVKSPDSRGDNILNTELEILTSLDLASQVAKNVGTNILAKLSPDKNVDQATFIIHKSLLAEVPKKSDVIRIIFQNPDPTVVQPVLTQLIESYLQRHLAIHREVGVFDNFLRSKTTELGNELARTARDLRDAKTNAGIISLDDSKKAYTEQIAKIRQEIVDAKAELAEHRGALGQVDDAAHPKATSTTSATNGATATNSLVATAPGAAPTTATNEPAKAAAAGDQLATAIQLASALKSAGTNAVSDAGATPAAGSAALAANTNAAKASPEQIAEYKNLTTRLDTLDKLKQQRLIELTPESPMVKSVQEEIDTKQKRKQQLETEFPELAATKAADTKTGGTGGTAASATARADLAAEAMRVNALESKIRVLYEQLQQVLGEASVMSDMELRIAELQRNKELQESQYKYFWANREQARIDTELGSAGNGQISNISKIEEPTPPYRAASKLRIIMAMAFLGSVAAALGLAFVIEFYFDRSIKRPIEIEGKLGVPLFLSIPRMARNGAANHLKAPRNVPLLTETSGNISNEDAAESADSKRQAKTGAMEEDTAAPSRTDSPVVVPPLVPGAPAPWEDRHALHPFWDALRDRLITYFEVKNLTHKPKLVALTSCATGSGVSTVAAGLAASLSETGDGNVLLVDMNVEQGAAHLFFKGKLACGLDDALELDKRENALVQDNLYVVMEATNGDKLPRVLPRRFNTLVPKLKASDYDYIIFDMPPVSQISVTPRLARFMDMVLMVVESEKTDQDVVKKATTWLTESKANVGIVLNKSQTYVPKRLQQEL